MEALKSLVSGIIGGLVFLLFFMYLKTNFILALVLGAAAYIAISTILHTEQVETFLVTTGIDRVNKEILETTISNATDKLMNIRLRAKLVTNRTMRIQIDEICELSEKILANVRKNPKNIKALSDFFNSHLDSAVNILTGYTDVMSVGLVDEEINAILRNAEKGFETLHAKFKSQLKESIRNELFELKVETATVEARKNEEGV